MTPRIKVVTWLALAAAILGAVAFEVLAPPRADARCGGVGAVNNCE